MSFGKGRRQEGFFYLDTAPDGKRKNLRSHGDFGPDLTRESSLDVQDDISGTDAGVDIALMALGEVLTEVAKNPRGSGSRDASMKTDE